MATSSQVGLHKLKKSGAFRLPSFIKVASCTTALAVLSTMTTGVAHAAPQGVDSVLHSVDTVLSAGAQGIPELAGAIADVQAEITRLNSLIETHREQVNRALVDLQDARTRQQQAKQGTATAKQELSGAQEAVAAAQEHLNELARTAYRRANNSEEITTAAGGDSRTKMLERQSFLNSQTQKQREVVSDLEKVRTEKANKESLLRKAELLAEVRETQAEQAESDARGLLQDTLGKVNAAQADRDALITKRDQVEAALRRIRGEQPRPQSPAAQAPAAQTAGAPKSATPTSSVPKAVTPPANTAATAATASAASAASAGSTAPAVQPVQAAPTTPTAPTVPPAPAVPAAPAAPAIPALGSSFGPIDQNMLQAGLTAFGAAASLVAASQPEHTNFTGSSTNDLKALQSVISVAGELASAVNGDAPAGGAATKTAAADDDFGATSLLKQLTEVLAPLDTAGSVTAKAASLVADKSADSRVEAVIARAMSQIGTPYAWGGGDANGPTKGIHDGGVADSYGDYNKIGFDCSGLTLYAFAAAGISLPHYSGYQYERGTKVNINNIKRGDLIFYGPGGSQHVGIYLGDGTMIEAPESGSTVHISPVRYSNLSDSAVRLIN